MRYTNQEKVDRRWSPNLAYAIGLITADGNLHPDGRHMHFVSKDKELVLNLEAALGISNRISKRGRGGDPTKRYYYINFGDKIFYGFLNKLGLTSAKSKTIKSVYVPDIYFQHFVRGLFDGDGTFYTSWDKRWPSSFLYQIAFASASKSFIDWFKNRLTELYSVKGVLCKGDGVYNLRYVKGDSFRLYLIMYPDNAGLLFLARKYNKISHALKFDGKI